MSIDPRIPLGVQPVQVPSPLDILQQVSQLQEQRAQATARQTAAQEAQAKRARQAQVDAAYEKAVKVDPQTGKVTVDRSVLLGGLPGSLVPSVMKELDADEQSVVNLQTATLNLHKAKQGHLASAAQTVLAAKGDPTIWGVELRGAHEMQLLDDEAYERLRVIDDPAQIQAIAQSFVTRADGEAPKPPAAGSLEDYVTRVARQQGVDVAALTPEALVAAKSAFEAAGRAPAAAPTPPNVGSFEDYVIRRYGETPTPEQIIEAHKAYQQADDRPITVNTGGGTAAENRESLITAVIDNPGLWDQITPTERGRIAGELRRRGFTGFGKPLPEGAIKQITQSKTAIAALTDLREVLKKNEQYIGPLAGLQALNPYSDARKAQADIDRVRQRVGKALEGGVLRKEDEEKYRLILATLRDTPETAIYKVDQLMEDLQRDIQIYTNEQRLAGRRVPQGETAGAPKEGTEGIVNGVPAVWKTINGKAGWYKK